MQYFEYHSSYFQSILKVNTYLTSPLSIELKQTNKIVEYFNMLHASNFYIEICKNHSGDN